MDDASFILIELHNGTRARLVFLSLLDWEGNLCDFCGSNIDTACFGVEYKIPFINELQVLVVNHELCFLCCEDVSHTVSLNTAMLLTEKYVNFSRSA